MLPNRVYDGLAPWLLKKVVESADRNERARSLAERG
jgi:hypothetical protein